MDVLTAWAIPVWLQGIKLTRIAPEKRDAILAFKREAEDVLYRHFSQQHSQPAATPALHTATLVPAEPIAQPEKPAPGSSRSIWIEYHHAMAEWLQWQEDIERWRQESDARQAELAVRQEELAERQDGLESGMVRNGKEWRSCRACLSKSPSD